MVTLTSDVPRRGLRRWLAVLATIGVTTATMLALTPASAATESRDVARDGTASARSTYNDPRFAVSNINDGSDTTRWGSRYTRTNPNDTYDVTGEWVQIALAKPTYILKVALDWEAAYSTDFDLQVSNDGANWTVLRSVMTPKGSATNGHLKQEFVVDTSDAWSFVRVTSRSTATAYGLSLYSFQVWDQPTSTPPGEAIDLAPAGKVTAKSFYDDRFVPSHANDGDPSTRWGTRYDRSTGADHYDNTQDWIQVELAAASRVHTVVLNWEAAYAKKFELQLSNDGQTWTSVYTGGASGAGVQELVIDTPQQWKFVRMQGRETVGIYGYSLFAFEIWGSAKPVVEPEPGGDIVPKPVSRTDVPQAEPFQLTADSRIIAEQDFSAEANQLATTLRASTGYALPITSGVGSTHDIVLAKGTADAGGEKSFQKEQAYRLVSSESGLTITASDPAGVWNGVQTLLQLLPVWVEGTDKDLFITWTVPATTIVDYPRIASRGLMVDAARNFMSVSEVKAVIDQLVRVKANRLHLHLSDDQGWRIQIDSWPKLTEISGKGSMANGKSGFYTKDDYRDLVKYASDRHVLVIPEIDVPGHVDAALHAYKELDCAERTIPLRTTGGISNNALCVGKPVVERFMKDVIRELAEMTPGPYIHIGADEVTGLSVADYSTFVKMTEQIVKDNGKTIIGWTPLPMAGVSTGAVHQYWADRNNHTTSAWFAGRPTVVTPANNAYMDYKFAGAPSRLGFREAIYSAKNQYNWDPSSIQDATTRKNMNKDFGLREDDIVAVEGAAWSETFTKGGEDLEFMLWPRMLGLMDKAWSTKNDTAAWAPYAERAGTQGSRLILTGANFFSDPEIPWTNAAVGRRLSSGPDGAVNGVVAKIASPTLTTSQLTAQITWPDGTTSVGQIGGTDRASDTAPSVFTVTGAHQFTLGAAATTKPTVSITGPGGYATTVEFDVDIPSVPVTPSITASAESVTAGGSVRVTGRDYPANAQLSVMLRPNGAKTPVTADADGAFATDLVTPADLSPGSYEIVVADGDRELVLPLTVNARKDPPRTPKLTLSAATVSAGKTLTAVVTGLLPGERLSFTFHSTPIEMGAATSDAQGTASLTWTVPANAAAGQHAVVARLADGSELRAPIRVTAANAGGGDAPATPIPPARGGGGSELASTGQPEIVSSVLLLAVLVIGGGSLLLARRARRA